jgi:hypothetical protein
LPAGLEEITGFFATVRKFGMVNRMGAHVCVPACASARLRARENWIVVR